MIRFLSIGGMTGGFLIISPGLRANVTKVYGMLVGTLNEASPWSYIIIGIGIFVLLTMEVYRYALPNRQKFPNS